MVRVNQSLVSFDVIPQTLAVSNLQSLTVGDLVNIELAMNYGDSVGGHMVQGHVDQTVCINALENSENSCLVTFSLPKELRLYIVNKGFVALDGMSLTVQATNDTSFSIALIPHTQSITIAQNHQRGSVVNLEVDMMAKYIQQKILCVVMLVDIFVLL